jgi:hypothetical protein
MNGQFLPEDMPEDDSAWAHEMEDPMPEGKDEREVHDTQIVVALEPRDDAVPQDIFLEQPGAIVIRNTADGQEIRINLGQCISLIHELTEIWMISYYG